MTSFPLSGHLTAKVPPERMLAAARRGGGENEKIKALGLDAVETTLKPLGYDIRHHGILNECRDTASST